MRKTSILTLFWITFLTLSVGLEIPMIPKVEGSPSMLPSDGDAWTENDNATYPWVCSPTYADDITFTNTTSMVGNYSLKVNHTSPTTYIAFYLDIGEETDLSSFDLVVFWFRVDQSANWTGIDTFGVYEGSPWSGNSFIFKHQADDNQWNRAVFPLEAFTESNSPSWTNRRYIAFQIAGVTSSDNTTVYVDGVHFTNWSTITESKTLNEIWLPNYESFLHRWKKTQTYNSNSYTSTWSMVPVSGTSDTNPNLETETLAQNIFGLMIAYDYSRVQHYLDIAKPYVDWLIKFQWLTNSSDRRYGALWSWYSGGSFQEGTGITYAGWQLGALSYYYSFTKDSAVKDVADKLRQFIIGTLWNDTNKWFDTINLATNVKNYATSWKGMPEGAGAIGLSFYYKYVSANTTVKTVLDQLLNKGLSLTQSHKFYRGTSNYEDSIYAWYGYYCGYKATNNQTYYNEAVKSIKLTRANYEQNLNGSCWYTTFCINTIGGFDGWGFACSLPLLFMIYKDEQKSNYLELFKNQILDLTPQILTGNNSITRKRQSGDEWVDYQYTPSNAFIVGALIGYYMELNKFQSPFLLSTNEEITSTSYSDEQLKFTVNNTFGASTSITKVYCGRSGKPKQVDGVSSWTYDDSDEIATLTVDHSSSQNVAVSWGIGTGGVYDLRVHVSENRIPVFGATVSIDGENETTDLLGDARFQLGYGFHSITVFCGDQKETREILVNRDRYVGFNFDVVIHKDRSIYVYIGLPIGVLIVAVVLIFLWRKH